MASRAAYSTWTPQKPTLFDGTLSRSFVHSSWDTLYVREITSFFTQFCVFFNCCYHATALIVMRSRLPTAYPEFPSFRRVSQNCEQGILVRRCTNLMQTILLWFYSHKWPLHVSGIYMSIFRSSYIQSCFTAACGVIPFEETWLGVSGLCINICCV